MYEQLIHVGFTQLKLTLFFVCGFFNKRDCFVSYRKPVYIHEISGRFDVGNLPSYIECDLYFRETLQDVESYMV